MYTPEDDEVVTGDQVPVLMDDEFSSDSDSDIEPDLPPGKPHPHTDTPPN